MAIGGDTLYVTHGTGNTVSVVDLPSRTVIDSLTVPSGAAGAAVVVDDHLYLTNSGPVGVVSVVDIDSGSSTYKSVTEVHFSDVVLSLAASPDGQHVFVSVVDPDRARAGSH